MGKFNFAAKMDDLIWSDCETCRTIRLGIALGAILVPVVMTVVILAVVK